MSTGEFVCFLMRGVGERRRTAHHHFRRVRQTAPIGVLWIAALGENRERPVDQARAGAARRVLRHALQVGADQMNMRLDET